LVIAILRLPESSSDLGERSAKKSLLFGWRTYFTLLHFQVLFRLKPRSGSVDAAPSLVRQ
jgi:hypothetical protein